MICWPTAKPSSRKLPEERVNRLVAKSALTDVVLAVARMALIVSGVAAVAPVRTIVPW